MFFSISLNPWHTISFPKSTDCIQPGNTLCPGCRSESSHPGAHHHPVAAAGQKAPPVAPGQSQL